MFDSRSALDILGEGAARAVHVADGDGGEGDLEDGRGGGRDGVDDGAVLPALVDVGDEVGRHDDGQRERHHPEAPAGDLTLKV